MSDATGPAKKKPPEAVYPGISSVSVNAVTSTTAAGGSLDDDKLVSVRDRASVAQDVRLPMRRQCRCYHRIVCEPLTCALTVLVADLRGLDAVLRKQHSLTNVPQSVYHPFSFFDLPERCSCPQY